ncbi:MAG: hypothetical protein IT178_18445 [Acidobacteria bacterium]|nr:hypothetical protein [Acidobacteriota bacterium]
MDVAPRVQLTPVITAAERIFGARLEAVVAYGHGAQAGRHSLVLVQSLTLDDLIALAAAAPSWHAAGVATPLVLPRAEFTRSLDAFPLEYGDIIDTHEAVHGADPFAGIRIDAADTRRALEMRAASHLLHLRENYVESAGAPAAVAALVHSAAPVFEDLLRQAARLDGAAVEPLRAVATWATERAGLDPRVVGDILALAANDTSGVDAARLFPSYLDTAAALVRFLDQWSAS